MLGGPRDPSTLHSTISQSKVQAAPSCKIYGAEQLVTLERKVNFGCITLKVQSTAATYCSREMRTGVVLRIEL